MSTPVPEKLYTSLSRRPSFAAALVVAKLVASVVAALAAPACRSPWWRGHCRSRSSHSPCWHRTPPRSPPLCTRPSSASRRWRSPRLPSPPASGVHRHPSRPQGVISSHLQRPGVHLRRARIGIGCPGLRIVVPMPFCSTLRFPVRFGLNQYTASPPTPSASLNTTVPPPMPP